MLQMQTQVGTPQRHSAGGQTAAISSAATAAKDMTESHTDDSYSCSDSYSYSYSDTYSYSDDYSQGTASTRSALTLTECSSDVVNVQSKFSQLPPRVPHPPQRPGGSSAPRAKQAVSHNKPFDSSNDSSSYGYSYSSNSNKEVGDNTTGSSGSYSYSYSSESTRNSDSVMNAQKKHYEGGENERRNFVSSHNNSVNVATTNKNEEKGVPFKVSSSRSSSYSPSYSYSYTDTPSDLYSGTYTTGDSSSDQYSYSSSQSTTGETTASIAVLSTITKGSQSESNALIKTKYDKAGVAESLTNNGSCSYSYSYSYDSKNLSGSSVLRSTSLINSYSVGSESCPILTDTCEKKATTIPLEDNKLHKKRKDHVAPVTHSSYSLSSETTTATKTPSSQTATETTAAITTTSLIADSMWHSSEEVMDHEISSSLKSSYGYTDELTTSKSDVSGHSTQFREVLKLAVPKDETPNIPFLPQNCLVLRGSANDTLSRFLGRLLTVQTDVMQKEKEEKAAEAAALANSGAKSGKESKTNRRNNIEAKENENTVEHSLHRVNIPFRSFTKRSLKFALRAVGVESPEERASALNGVILPLSFETTLTFLMGHAHRCLLQRIRSMFLAHDKFYSGEVPLEIALDLLWLCGIASRNVENITMCLCASSSSKKRFPILRVTQRLPGRKSSISATEEEEEEEEELLLPKMRVKEEIVDVCGSLMSFSNFSAFFDDQKGDIYVGNSVVLSGITSCSTARNIVMQLDALIYVCRALQACTVDDRISCTVMYTPLLSALLSPKQKNIPPGANSIVFENALFSVFQPEKRLEKLSAYHCLQKRYLGDGEDAVLANVFSEHCFNNERSVMQSIKPNIGLASNMNIDDRAVENEHMISSAYMYCEVALTKLRLKEEVPPNARCYCLVSVRSLSDNMWMPAITVPVAKVGASKKGGFKWTFHKSQNKNHLLFASRSTDRLYLEACYDVVEADGEKVTWCAGHVFVACGEVKSGKLQVSPGSVFSDDISFSPGAKPAKFRRRFFCCLGKKKDAKTATSLTVVAKPLMPTCFTLRASLPACFVVFRRHVSLIARLREAVAAVHGGGRTTLHPLCLLRQQQVRCCLAVADSPALMDVLQELWDRAVGGKMGPRPKTALQQQKTILSLVLKVAAASNNTAAGDKEVIANVVARGAAIPFSATLTAPQCPVHI